ncbi:MAG: 2-C-methyl-D-erythritol 2,4-cyclodiphosphate synthase [Gammaproteobacteria bacterium]
MRIGHGYDVHRFCTGKKLMLGGVEIPYEFGLEAHSDGDVIIHAICDALLGAAALGDIGQHFSEQEPEFKNIDSRILLRRTHSLMADYAIQNIDVTVVAQAPKLAPYIDSMRKYLAQDLKLEVSQLNIKATTTEKLGFTGRKEGIAVYAVALISRLRH